MSTRFHSDEALRQAREFLSRHLLLDGHNDLATRLRADGYSFDGLDTGRPEFDTDIPRIRAGGLGGQFWSVYVPSTLEKHAAVTSTLEQIDAIHGLVAAHPDVFALTFTADQVRAAFADGKVASLLGAEGGHSIARSPGVLRTLARLGLRYLTLTHFQSNEWADSSTDGPRATGQTASALNPEGASVLAALNSHGIIADLSHTSDDTQRAVLNSTDVPVLFSHSSAFAVTPHPRNVKDDILESLKSNGGVVQAAFVSSFLSRSRAEWEAEADRLHPSEWSWPAQPLFPGAEPEEGPADASTHDDGASSEEEDRFAAWLAEHPRPRVTVKDAADHLDHLREVAGVEHIGIGGDFDGASGFPEGLEDVSAYPTLFAELKERGWSGADLAALAGENVLRILQATEDAARDPLWPGAV
ncbi:MULTISPECIES: dipeptidase [Arthrobacter]|uniref:Dipeptidase n=2 Tax=Arthrobacter TaxID=1663 RepID=A0ABU9KR40_9MICC|nr:dipeptidase [Arthrobacter sp. YJM1]MDP5228631.1 dipeptidase [Arthrobacter sp. YJM1]